MADSNTVDVYYDMDIAEICRQFSKSRNTVDKAVAKLVKDHPDKNYKYKNEKTRRITITAEGVAVLANYFRKEKKEVSIIETQLRAENEKLTAILAEREKTIKMMDTLYQQKLKLELEKSHQTFLLEMQDKQTEFEKLQQENQELKKQQEENEKLKEKLKEYNSKSLFYRLFHKFEDEN